MCGVAGIVALSGSATAPQRAELMRMATALQHRGPDQLGLYARGPAGLAHARLSIIDLAGGKQPMAAARERALIAYNGEVFKDRKSVV